MSRRTSRASGFTLVELTIVLAILGVLAAIAIPNFLEARKRAEINACLANLTQIKSAQIQAAVKFRKPSNGTVSEGEVTPFLDGNALPPEPANGTYTVGSTVSDNPKCSIHLDLINRIRNKEIVE